MSSAVETIFVEPLYLLKEKTWVILSEPWSAVGNAECELLQKILTAVGSRIESVVIQHQPVLDLSVFPNKPSRLIYFGPPVNGLSQNEVITLNGTSVILSNPLSALQNDAAAKQKLWQSLKVLFKA